MLKIQQLLLIFSLVLLIGCISNEKTIISETEDVGMNPLDEQNNTGTPQTSQKENPLEDPFIYVCGTMMDLSEDEIVLYKSTAQKYMEDQGAFSITKDISLDFSKIKNNQLIEIFEVEYADSKVPAICSTTSDIEDNDNTYFVRLPEDNKKYTLVLNKLTAQDDISYYYLSGLVKKDEKWEVLTTYLQMASFGGKTKKDFYSMSDIENQKGNTRTSIFYEILATAVNINNPYISSHTLMESWENIQKRVSEADTQQIYEEWTVDSGNTYKIYSMIIEVATDEGKPIQLINIKYLTDDLEDQQKIKSESLEIAKHVKTTYPEYEKIFYGVLVSSSEKIPAPQETIPLYNNIYEFDKI